MINDILEYFTLYDYFMIIFAILGGLFFYKMKFVCKKNGYRINPFNDPRDIINFIHIIKNEEKQILKKRYIIIIWGHFLCTFIFLLLLALRIINEI